MAREISPRIQSLTITSQEAGKHLDTVLAHYLGLSRRQARLLIKQGGVQLNGRQVNILTKPVRLGQKLQVVGAIDAKQRSLPSGASSVVPVGSGALPLVILYSDPEIVVLVKPAGLLTEVDRRGSVAVETLLPAQLRQLGEKSTQIWLVHRLDAGTSGVLLVARTARAARRLSADFREQKLQKTYLALTSRLLKGGAGESNPTLLREQPYLIDLPLAKLSGTNSTQKAKHVVDYARGKVAKTTVCLKASVLYPYKQWSCEVSLIEAQLHTGRTHQIRAHLAHLGYPLLGDRRYGGVGYLTEPDGRLTPLAYPYLHARSLTFKHPQTGALLTFTAPLSADFQAVLRHFKLSLPAEL